MEKVLHMPVKSGKPGNKHPHTTQVRLSKRAYLLLLEVLQQLEAAGRNLVHARLELLGQHIIGGGQQCREGQGGNFLVVLSPKVPPPAVLPEHEDHLHSALPVYGQCHQQSDQ